MSDPEERRFERIAREPAWEGRIVHVTRDRYRFADGAEVDREVIHHPGAAGIVAHDDLHVFETIQQALRAGGNPWVSLARGLRDPERDGEVAEVGGTDERLIRNQFRAWAAAMADAPAA